MELITRSTPVSNSAHETTVAPESERIIMFAILSIATVTVLATIALTATAVETARDGYGRIPTRRA